MTTPERLAHDGPPAGPRLTVVHAMTYRFPAGWEFGPEEVPYSLVRLITAGTARFSFDGIAREVGPDDVVMIPEGTLLASDSADGLTFTSVRFTTSLTVNGRDLLADGFAVPMVSRVEDMAAMRWHFEALAELWRHPTPARSFLSVGHLHLILGALLAQAHAEFTAARPTVRRPRIASRTPDARMERVIDRLSESPRDTVEVGELLSLTHMSESTLRRAFRRYTGKTIGEYHRELRMLSAAEALLLTDAGIGSVASDAGYDDASYFSRVFRAVFGVSPAHYRQSARQG